jgi:ABC-2 type transport system permease protein
VLSALLYLRLTSAKNWVIARGRRLRQPKYLIGAIVGCAYFYFFFFRPMSTPAGPGGRHAATAQAMQAAQEAMAIDWLPITSAFGALVLLALIVFMWVVPAQRAALGFSEAEIAFLFPAPVTRRALVHFRLLSSQFRSLLGAAVMMLFTNRWTILGGNALTHAIGWWFIFSALNLHFSGANFTLTRLADLGLGAWRRRVWTLLAIIIVVAATVTRLPVAHRLPAMSTEFDLRPITEWIVNLTTTAPLGWVLWPFKVVLGPFLAVDTSTFLWSLGPALALISLHYLWVVRTAVAFEDASLDYAQKRSARIDAWRSGQRRLGAAPAKGRRGPFRLAGTGRPELAFLWKNLLSTWEYFTVRVWLGCAAVIVIGCVWLNTQASWRGFLTGAGGIAAMFGLYTLIAGPQFARQDIRSDLVNADILKTYPLAGWQIVLGEMLTPVAIITGLLWLVLLTMVLTFHPMTSNLLWLTPQLRVACAIGFAVLAPALVTLQILVPNAAALLFPSWFQTARLRGGGPEVIGQRMIFFFAQVITMVLALMPAAGMAAGLLLVMVKLLGVWEVLAVLIAAGAVVVVLVAEVWCGVWWLGGRFEKLDLSAELRA